MTLHNGSVDDGGSARLDVARGAGDDDSGRGAVRGVRAPDRLSPSWVASAAALLPHGLTCRRQRVCRGEWVWHGGIAGRFVGWHPDRPAPLVAWQPERFTSLCRYFDALDTPQSFWSVLRALSRAGTPPPRWLMAPWVPVASMFGAVGMVCLVPLLGAPPWLAVLAAVAPAAAVWLLSLEWIAALWAAVRLRGRLGVAP